MFMRNYPDRITTKRLVAEDRHSCLANHELRTMEYKHVEDLSGTAA